VFGNVFRNDSENVGMVSRPKKKPSSDTKVDGYTNELNMHLKECKV